MPSVSIVITSYNYARFLPRAIGSALAQEIDHLEIVIVDNASTDESWAIIEAAARDHAIIRAFRNETNLGLVGNHRRGLELAQGKRVLFLSADDYLLPGHVRRALAFQEEWDGALREYLEAVQTDPQLAEAHYNLGVSFAARGQLDRARNFFELALAGTPTEETLSLLETSAREGDVATGGEKLRRVLATAMSSGGQGARDGGRKVQKQMKAVGDLLGGRRTQLRTLRIYAAAVPADHANPGLLLEPRLEALGQAGWQEVRYAMLLQIHQNRSVGLSFAPSPIIDTENLDRVVGIRKGRRSRSLHSPQYCVIADADGEAGQEPSTR